MMIIRNPDFSEERELFLIWKTVFGDRDSLINKYFELYYTPHLCVAAEVDDRLVSAGYVIPAGHLNTGMERVTCGMIYAVGTLPEYRGRGYGKAVTRALIQTGFNSGFTAIILHPSADSLFDYYASNTEIREWFYVNERCYDRFPDTFSHALTETARPISLEAMDYTRVRERFLSDIPVVTGDPKTAEYLHYLCTESGGGLYAFLNKEGEYTACAAVEKHADGTVYINELLSYEGFGNTCFYGAIQLSTASVKACLTLIAERHPADKYIVRLPAHRDDPSIKRFGMLISSRELKADNDSRIAPWYGPAFD